MTNERKAELLNMLNEQAEIWTQGSLHPQFDAAVDIYTETRQALKAEGYKIKFNCDGYVKDIVAL